MEISHLTAEVLGFGSQTQFGHGESKASNPMNNIKFVEMTVGTIFDIKLFTKSTEQIHTVQDPSEYKVDKLVESINIVLASAGILMSVQDDVTQLSANEYPVIIEFSRAIASVFSLPPLVHLFDKPYSQSTQINWKPAPQMLCIATDLIEPCSYGSSTVNYLRVVNQTNETFGQLQHMVFNPVIYHRVNRNFIQTINIVLCDEYLRQYELGTSTVTVTLSVRERWRS